MRPLVDELELTFEAGDGGNGMISFRREKFVPRGGPDGGDGGDGGSIYFLADHNLNSLSHLSRSRLIRAPAGQPGQSAKKHGKAGQELVIKAPVGTQVFEESEVKIGSSFKKQRVLLADLDISGQKFLLAKGGKGGFGNAHFKRAAFQTPRFAELGEPGEKKEVTLSLKMIAEVGLIGLPNAGKSTLLSVISAARPKIAPYPFTTLEPNLGVVEGRSRRFVVAEIPGLIEDAHRGKGLGIQFLKHAERTKLLLHLIDVQSPDSRRDFATVRQELKSYSPPLARKMQFVVFTKMETVPPMKLAALKKLRLGKKQFFISAATHQGLGELLRAVEEALSQAGPVDLGPAERVFTLQDVELERFEVLRRRRRWEVVGDRVSKLVRQTDFENEEAVIRLYKVLQRLGVLAELKKRGLKEGEEFEVAGKRIEYRRI